jgi:uncharacterized membrane protein
MKAKPTGYFWQTLSLGILAGMRTFAAPVVVSHILSNHPAKALSGSPLKFMQSIKVATGLKIAAIGELVGDKLPFTPNRTEAGGVIGRCLSGALAGATIYKANSKNMAIGVLIGSAAAFASTFGCYFLRKTIVKNTHIDDPWIGALEDTIVISSAIVLIKSAA